MVANIDDDRQDFRSELPLTSDQASVLRKHLTRETMSLDDAAVLVGIPVDELAVHFQGRRAGRPMDGGGSDPSRKRRRRVKPYDPNESSEIENEGLGLRAPARGLSMSNGRSAVWAGSIMAVLVVAGGLALLSGIPQSLLFPPRGVSEHKPVDATVAAQAPVAEETPAVASEPAAAPPAVDPITAEAQPGDAAPADGAAPPSDATVAEAPVPAAPEEVPVAVAEGEPAAETLPEPPAFTAPAPAVAQEAPPPAPTETVSAAPAGPATVLYAARQAVVRDAPTATGSATVAQIKRGETVSGTMVPGADGKSSWLKIETGPGVGGFVSATNMSPEPRPAVAQAIGKTRILVQAAALHAGPDAGSKTLDNLKPGISVLAAAEVDGGWIEIHRRAGGVGYIRKEAFE